MLYIHIPYCHHKCTYCGFYSLAGHRDIDGYVDAVCCEIELRHPLGPVRTVYFGGGTPTLLSATQLERIVQAIHDNCDLSQLEETTIEANPENLTPEYVESLANLGFFNRISIGIQSFNDKELKILNRVHNSRQAMDAIENAAKGGFTNISVDLIMGLPYQTVEGWKANLDRLTDNAAFSSVKHLSCYELTVEPGSILERQLQRGMVTLCDDETVGDQYQALQSWCRVHGFEQYEISNYCRHGFHSRHNSRYWDRTPYVGIGAAAHSFDGQRRRWNIADAEAYIEGCRPSSAGTPFPSSTGARVPSWASNSRNGVIPYEEELLTAKDAYNEYVMTSLRTVRGIEISKIDKEYLPQLLEKTEIFEKEGLLTIVNGFIVPTAAGLLHADGIAERMFV